MKRSLFLMLGLMLAAGAAAADEVVLKDGRVIEGEVIAKGDDQVTVKSTVGLYEVSTTVPAAEVASIKKTPSRAEALLTEYRLLRAKIDPQKPDDLFRLGKWMAEHEGFESAAQKVFERALELDPNHEATRKHLGYTKGPDGKWRAPGAPEASDDREAIMLADIMQALGLMDDEDDARSELPYGRDPFEEINYRFYRDGFGRNEYLGLRFREYGLVGARRPGIVDLVNGQMFDHRDYFDEVLDPLSGQMTLVHKALAGGASPTSLPPVAGVYLWDVPAYNAAAARLGLRPIPQVGITPRIPIQE